LGNKPTSIDPVLVGQQFPIFARAGQVKIAIAGSPGSIEFQEPNRRMIGATLVELQLAYEDRFV
jgi:hypothetical protein